MGRNLFILLVRIRELLCFHNWGRSYDEWRERECSKCGRRELLSYRHFIRFGNGKWGYQSRKLSRFFLLLILMSSLTYVSDSIATQSLQPAKPFATFESAKKVARDVIYADNPVDIYCGCRYTPKGESGGVIDARTCGYTPRKNAARGKQLEWEHIVPASYFGTSLICWHKGSPKCKDSEGKPFKGRKCCSKIDATFKRLEADLHNLAPSVGELNGDRSNLPYGMVIPPRKVYGTCDFVVGGSPAHVQPPMHMRGDVSRVWLYMSCAYDLKMSSAQLLMFQQWAKQDPPDAWELLRDSRILAAQGNSNPFVHGRKSCLT